METQLTTLADRLRYAMQLRGARLVDLATAAGVKPPSASDWLSGKTKSLGSVPALALSTYLQIDQQWLLTGVGPLPVASASVGRIGFSERLKSAIAHAGRDGEPLDKLGQHFGVSGTMVSNYLSGEKVPRMSTASRIASALGVRVEWLLSGSGAMLAEMELPRVTEQAAPYSIAHMPELSLIKITGMVAVLSSVQAGAFCEAPVDDSEVSEWLPRMPGHGERTFALRVDGDSMTSPYPGMKSYPRGTYIYVDPDADARNGSPVVVKLPDSQEVTFKLLMMDAGKTFLKPINPQYPMIEVENFQICGVVRGSYTPE